LAWFIWFVLEPGFPLSFPVLLPLTLLLFFHLAGGLQEVPKILILGFWLKARVAAAASVAQLAFPDSSIRMRLIESPTCPFTWEAGGEFESSCQRVTAMFRRVAMESQTLAAPKPEMVW
jgi:hypothetical protein